ncbi:hypothetical protein F511_20106 [Dorcoceras hygrometricum]|uniref:Uncharacterized protein n=1 Tax=Dorcoceras hygrometricum TaxID=472368 RepID=A0A2Z7CEB4_9LAMI|nr:hypothetical protein F511_20106 [Dorcoceras hygrometricum]
MASSLISNTIQVYFASVLGMDNEGMVAMFEALISSGLNGFLGCSSALYEAALVDFFQNASVRDGQVVSNIQGKPVEISEKLFARTFELPMEGLTDMHEVPKDLVFDVRIEFSFNGEQLSTSCKKREMKFEFRLLSDILAKSVTVKAGSFVRQARGYAVQIFTLLKNVPDLELGDSKEFPSLKILTAKTVSRYISINKNIVVEDVDDEPRVKKTPVKKAVSKKRSAATADKLVVKRKRTIVGKAAVVAKDSALVTVAQEAVLLQIVAPIFYVPPAPNAEPQRGKEPILDTSAETAKLLELEITGVDEIEKIVEQQDNELTADDVDTIIGQLLADTTQMEADAGETDVGEQIVQKYEETTTDEESMSLDELLATIPHGSVLPSTVGEITKIQFGHSITIRGVNEGDWYKASLPKIPADDKGKAPLHERYPIKGHPAPALKSDEDIYAKEEQVLIWAETDSTKVALQRRMYILIKYRELLLRKFLEARRVLKSVRQDVWNEITVLSVQMNEFKKAVRNQGVLLKTDVADVRKEVKEQKSELFTKLDERLATIRSDLLDFRAQEQENHLNLSTQLVYLVEYINRGGDAKKGESGSSHFSPLRMIKTEVLVVVEVIGVDLLENDI